MNQFPYTNFHELNLDWILQHMKEVVTMIREFEGSFPEISARLTQLEQDVLVLKAQIADLDETGTPEVVTMNPGAILGTDGEPLNRFNYQEGIVAAFAEGDDVYKYAIVDVEPGSIVTVYGLDPTADIIQLSLVSYSDSLMADVIQDDIYSGIVNTAVSVRYNVPTALEVAQLVIMLPQTSPDPVVIFHS